MKSAAMTPLSMMDLSELNIGRTLRMRKRTRATKKRLPKTLKEGVNPPPPPSSSESPQPNTPREQIHTSSDEQRHSLPTLSLNISISNEAPPSKSPTPIPSPSSPAAPTTSQRSPIGKQCNDSSMSCTWNMKHSWSKGTQDIMNLFKM
nr:hypothetical protein Itr_chr01CG04310 [Ipomoea trifida]